jgi:hypothetical protein
MQEFVVPKSMPITFAIRYSWTIKSESSQAMKVPVLSVFHNTHNINNLQNSQTVLCWLGYVPKVPLWHAYSEIGTL